jgi:hypothetical protein
MNGYRVGYPEKTTAWQVLNFEYEELENDHLLDDVARFLGMPKSGHYNWPSVLEAFRSKYGDAPGEWVCPTLRDAITYYGDYYGPGTEILQVSYDPKNVVSDLGADGRFVVNPESTREIGQDLLAPVKGLLAKAARSYHQRYDR